jgi:hypothetical protein
MMVRTPVGIPFRSNEDPFPRACGVARRAERHYRRGVSEAFNLGKGHGILCLGCCWAIMLVMFAAGVASLWWMAAPTALMVYEKTGRSFPQSHSFEGVSLAGEEPPADNVSVTQRPHLTATHVDLGAIVFPRA